MPPPPRLFSLSMLLQRHRLLAIEVIRRLRFVSMTPRRGSCFLVCSASLPGSSPHQLLGGEFHGSPAASSLFGMRK